jgi:hypothetical protein
MRCFDEVRCHTANPRRTRVACRQGETLTDFVEAAVRNAVAFRHVQTAFQARAQVASGECHRTGVSVPVETVLQRRQVKLAPKPRSTRSGRRRSTGWRSRPSAAAKRCRASLRRRSKRGVERRAGSHLDGPPAGLAALYAQGRHAPQGQRQRQAARLVVDARASGQRTRATEPRQPARAGHRSSHDRRRMKRRRKTAVGSPAPRGFGPRPAVVTRLHAD